MPSRRRPSETSARARALLDSADRTSLQTRPDQRARTDQPARLDQAARTDQPARVDDPVRPDQATGLGRPARSEVVPWLPDRTWIETGALGTPVGLRATTVVPGAERPGRHRRPLPPGPRFLTIPAALRGARLSGPRAAAAGLLLVVLVAAVGFGARVAWAKAASTPHVVAPSQAGSALGGRGPTGVFASSSTSSGGGGPPAGTVTVHVVGQVQRPGVFTMPAGSRVSDAVTKAGVRKGADLAAINLARPLVDGEQIRVPKPGEVLPGGAGAAGSVAGGSGAAGSGAGGQPGPGGAGPVNLNSATAAQLEELPGVGPVLAQRIIDWRTEHGRFASVDELGEVSGIGEKIFAALQPKVSV